MSVTRIPSPWQRFVDLLPDTLERDELMDVLVPVIKSGADLDLLYSAIDSGIEAKKTEEYHHKVLSDSNKLSKKVKQGREKLLDAEQNLKIAEQNLTPERKEAIRRFHPLSTGPYDSVLQSLHENIEILEKQIVPEAKTGRSEGNQPHEYARRTDERIKAAGIRSDEYRDRLLRVYGLKPHRKL